MLLKLQIFLVISSKVSKQCMEMVAEGVLELSSHLGYCQVNSTFTVIQEGKPTSEVLLFC